MSGFFGHVNAMPFILGLLYALGVLSMWHKVRNGHPISAAIECAIFVVLFLMHNKSTDGGAGAVVAALVLGVFLPSRRKA